MFKCTAFIILSIFFSLSANAFCCNKTPGECCALKGKVSCPSEGDVCRTRCQSVTCDTENEHLCTLDDDSWCCEKDYLCSSSFGKCTQCQITKTCGGEVFNCDDDETGYVSNGLYLHYDGCTPTRDGSTPADVWENIGGGGHDTVSMVSAPVYVGNGWSFDGSDDGFILDPALRSVWSTPSFTFEFMFTPISTDDRDILIGTYPDTAAFNIEKNGGNMGSRTKGVIRFYWNGGAPDYYSDETLAFQDERSNITITYDGSKLKFYKNAVLTDTRNGALSVPTPANGPIYLFRDGRTGSTCFGGVGHAFRVYNRPLTDAEVLQNYNADKLRYDN